MAEESTKPEVQRSPSASLPWLSRLFRVLVAKPRPGESDARFGLRLALYGPVAFYLVFAVALMILPVDGEAALGLTLSYWLFIGMSQLMYLVPGIVAAIIAKRRSVALGMVQGAGLVAGLNAIAWFIGYYVIGAQ